MRLIMVVLPAPKNPPMITILVAMMFHPGAGTA